MPASGKAPSVPRATVEKMVISLASQGQSVANRQPLPLVCMNCHIHLAFSITHSFFWALLYIT